MLNPSLPLKTSLSRPVDNLDTKNLKEYFYVLVLPVNHRENGFTVAYVIIFDKFLHILLTSALHSSP